MALQDKMAQEAPQDEMNLTDDEEQDLQIAVLMGEQLFEEGGYDAVAKAMTSKDPGQVVGQFMMQFISQMFEQLPPDITLSKRIVLAEGGLVEQLMDMLIANAGIDKKTADRAEIYIGTTAQAMAGSAKQQEAAAPQAPGPAPVPAVPGPEAAPQGVM